MATLLQDENLISIKELSEKLSVSVATVNNWIRLNKIQPYITGKQIFFTAKYSDSLVKQLNSDKSRLLKSRRNKKYITGSFFYKDYISNSSKNITNIKDLIDYISFQYITLSIQEIKYIIADCAIQLLFQRYNISITTHKNYLKKYLENNITLGIYSKLIDDLIDDSNIAIKFLTQYPEIFKNYTYETNEDILGLLYISLSDLNNRKANGAYYTPTKIVQKVINQINLNNFNDKKIIDPCCGSGNFLLQLPNNLNIAQVYGNDIDNTAICITRINMALKFKIQDIKILYDNFTCTNFLTETNNLKFDYIIGNPPWGANFNANIKQILKNKYISAQNRNIESYDVFIEKSLSELKLNGNLLFVVPEAILSVKNHKTIRKIILLQNSIKYVEYLGNIFNKVNCPSVILQIQRTNKPLSTIGLEITSKNKSFIIKSERNITFDMFNFYMNDDEYAIYKKILNDKNNVYLKDNATFALGIVTGDNKKYINNKKTSSNEIILKGSDIDKFKVKSTTNYIDYKLEVFQQTAPLSIYRTKEKLLYRFISRKLIFAYDNNQTLTLNSCNILIPNIKNLNIKYVMAILNSKIAQFIFEKKYNSVKVLRFHIENIPIPLCDTNKQTEIVNIVDKILEDKNKNKEYLYNELEEKIYKLYNLTLNEYNIILKALKN